MEEVIGLSGIFFLSAGTCLLGAAGSLLFIPTTLNKTVTELENLFVNNNNNESKESKYENLDGKTFPFAKEIMI